MSYPAINLGKGKEFSLQRKHPCVFSCAIARQDPEIKKKRAPSGFAKPTTVTKELCEFMNLPDGTEIARTEVTKALIDYIKKNKLENQTNSKFLIPDDKLKI